MDVRIGSSEKLKANRNLSLFYLQSNATNPPDKLIIDDKEYIISSGIIFYIKKNSNYSVISSDPRSYRVINNKKLLNLRGLDETKKLRKTTVQYIKTIFYASIIAIIIRSLLVAPFKIPSKSMLPNLFIGDFIFVTKYSYGYSEHSFPFSIPIFKGRVFFREPKRGDIIVFRLPSDLSKCYIKRLIGLPQDRVQMIKGVVYVNNLRQDIKLINNNIEELNNIGYFYKETNVNSIEYIILDNRQSPGDNTELFEVPLDNYFFLGDNRDNSLDSRFPDIEGSPGFVPKNNLVGKAQFIFFSLNRDEGNFFEFWKWHKLIRFNRLFKKIK
jgi:signal peptidase I